jgi:alcohol dehydrogenase class IV
MVLTDEGVANAGLAELVKESLADFCAGIYREIPSDPDIEAVDRAVEAARELRADGIVSVGGGSVIDAGKVVCVALKSGGNADDYLNRWFALTEAQTPHIVVPTTAGTGSEVTNVAVITSKNAGRKLFLADRWIIPNAAILDPRFTLTLPVPMTVSTAMDALTHAIEALTSTMSNPICDGHALNAISLIHRNLPLVIANGKDEKARLALQIAATAAGWAFTTAQVGLAHAMAHSVGTLYKVPHGTACGIVIAKVMRYNLDCATEKLALIARQFGVNTVGIDQRDAALAAAEAVEALMKKVGHPLGLREVGVPEDALPQCALHAIADSAVLFNARRVTDPGEVLALFQQAF